MKNLAASTRLRAWFFVIALFLAGWAGPAARGALSAVPAKTPPAPEVHFTTPAPHYPQAAMKARIEGEGIVQAVFDQHGEVSKASMVKSTGSIILDMSTEEFVRRHWSSSGGTKLTHAIAVSYRMPAPPKGQPAAPALPPELARLENFPRGLYVTPHPYYPDICRTAHVSGTVVVNIRFGANGGRPERVTILQSSGNDKLDGYTADFIRLYWRYLAAGPVEKTTVVEYRLH